MSELPTCKLCGSEPFEFSVQCECDNENCSLYEVEMKKEDWRALMGEASPEPESAEPVAILCREIGETSWFDHTPLKPGSSSHIARNASPGWDTRKVYTNPPKQEQWIKFDYDNPPDDGVYWLEAEYPEWDVDIDDYGKTVGEPTGETIKAVFLGRLDMFDDNPDGEPYVYHVIEDVNGELKPDVDWAILRYAKPQPPQEMSDCVNDGENVTVCASCKRASCWQGQFYCDDYRAARTVELTVSELKELNLEHPSYWKDRDDE